MIIIRIIVKHVKTLLNAQKFSKLAFAVPKIILSNYNMYVYVYIYICNSMTLRRLKTAPKTNFINSY